MTFRIVLLAGVLTVVGLVSYWWWLSHCERACDVAERDAEGLLRRGEPLSALALIDEVDARCRCERFTSGDAPPQYVLAQACLRQLAKEGRSAEAARVLARARGSILMELAKQDDSHQRD